MKGNVVLGAMGLSTLDQQSADRIIHCALDHGITAIDTAPLYGAGRCEELVGRAIADRRSHVRVLTKCGLRWDDRHGQKMFQMTIDGIGHWVRKDSRPVSIAPGIDESLRRLGVETIDLMQIHHFDAGTPLEDSLAELVRAREAGKILAIGISNFPIAEQKRANHLLAGELYSVQDEFNLLSTDRSASLLEHSLRSDIRFLAYSPLAGGVLTGKYLDEERLATLGDWRAAYMAPSNLRRINAMLMNTARPLADSHGATIGQLCLAWALSQPGVTDVVAGASSEQQAIENAGVMRLAIPAEELRRLEAGLEACGLDPSPRRPLAQRLRNQTWRIRHLGGRVLRGLGLR